MPCRIVATITEPDVDSALQRAASVGEFADLIEFRLDAMRRPEVRALAGGSPLPAVLTNRARADGGQCPDSREERIQRLLEAAAAGPAYVDAEHDIAAEVVEHVRGMGVETKVIASAHDFASTPRDPRALIDLLAATGADEVKIAAMPHGPLDAARLLRAAAGAAKDGVAVTAVSMGEQGAFTRVLAGAFGCSFTYAAANPQDPAAPGQMPARAMREQYRAHRVGPKTRRFAVLGWPVAHSRSPMLFNTLFARRGLDAVYTAIPAPVGTDLGTLLDVLELSGASVTIPHKQAALRLAAVAGVRANRAGAANALSRLADGAWRAENTDVAGVLEACGNPRGKRALIVGAGGAARAAASGLRDAGNHVVVWNRTRDRARNLAAELEVRAQERTAPSAEGFDLVINATPVGMTPREEETVFQAGDLGGRPLVFDMVYTPVETRLIREARAAGCPVVHGIVMFAAQAAEQLRLFTGEETSAREILEILEPTRNGEDS